MVENTEENSIDKSKEPMCDCCGKSLNELQEFELKLPLDYANINTNRYKVVKVRLVRTYRIEHEDDDMVQVSSSWECKNCLGFSTMEYWNIRNSRPCVDTDLMTNNVTENRI